MAVKIADVIAAETWAITQSGLQQIIAIANREVGSIESIETRLGKPLNNTREVTVRDGVAVIPLTGPIMRYANIFTMISGATSLEMFMKDFQAADDDPSIHTIAIKGDSPGGMAAAISEGSAIINNSKTRVVAHIDNQAASACYWLISAADEVYISKTAFLGSIGSVIEGKVNKKSNHVELVSKQSPKKRPDLGSKKGRKQVRKQLNSMTQVFIEDVAMHRNVSVDHVLSDFGQGDMLMGEDAIKAGMADGIMTFEDLMAELISNNNTKGTNVMAKKSGKSPMVIASASAAEGIGVETMAALEAKKAKKAKKQKKAEMSSSENERGRIKKIVSCDEAKGRTEQAQHLAFNTSMSAKDAIAILATAPKQATGSSASPLAEAMAEAEKDQPQLAEGAVLPGDSEAAEEQALVNAISGGISKNLK